MLTGSQSAEQYEGDEEGGSGILLSFELQGAGDCGPDGDCGGTFS